MENNTKINIGKNIKQLRIKRKFPKRVITEYLDVDQDYVSRLEDGNEIPTGDILESLAALFGCTIKELLSGEEVKNPYRVTMDTIDFELQELQALAAINKIATNQKQMDQLRKEEKNETNSNCKFQ